MASRDAKRDVESVTFLQSCPVCGRRLHIAVEYDGAEVVCFHCRAVFRARNVVATGVPLVGRSPLRNTVRVGDSLVAAASG